MRKRWRYVAAISTVLLWSTATVVSGILSGRYPLLGARNSIAGSDVFPLVFFILVFGFIIFLALVLTHKSDFLRELRGTTWRTRVYVLSLGALVPGYLLTYYYSLLFSPPLNAYVIIYLWPIFFFLFSGKRRRGTATFSLNELLMLALAFGGSALVILESKVEAVDWRHLPGYLSAVGSALFIALTFVVIDACTADPSPSSPGRGRFSKNYYVYFAASFIGIILLAILIPTTGQSFRLNHVELYGAAWLGCVVFAVAHLFWTFALKVTLSEELTSRLTALIYFTPVVSAAALYFTFGERVTAYTVLGIALVILGNLFIQTRYTYINAVTVASSSAVVIGVFCYLTTNAPSNQDILALYSLLSTLFAIVNGFTLTRLAGKRASELQDVREISNKLELIKRAFAKAFKGRYSAGAESSVNNHADLLFRWIVDIDFGVRCRTHGETILKVDEALDKLERLPKKIKETVAPAGAVSTEEIDGLLLELKGKVDSWLDAKFSRIYAGETAANWLLGGLTMAAFLFYRGNSFFGDILATFASPVVIFLLLALRDYSSGRLERDFLSIVTMQRKFIRRGGTFYLPKKIFLNQDFIPPSESVSIRYSNADPCSKDVDDELVSTTISGESAFWQWLVRLVIVIMLGVITFLLYDKHH
jgi:drug/metabolite transporter (DMT)-like permease